MGRTQAPDNIPHESHRRCVLAQGGSSMSLSLEGEGFVLFCYVMLCYAMCMVWYVSPRHVT